jgi:signal transduction histidine kinase
VASQTPGTVGALLALVAHDLRNPLSALHSNVGFLEATLTTKDPDALDALSDISASCSSLKHIIDNLELLGLAVVEDRPSLDRQPLSLWDLAYEGMQRLQAIADSYGVRMLFEGDRQGAPRVLAHREMVSRALGNLLFNSIQNGGTSEPVRISLASDGTNGTIRVVDAGARISTAMRESAFSADGQLSCKGDPQGRYSRGLGLFAASVAAGLGGANVKSLDAPDGRNAFELVAPLA